MELWIERGSDGVMCGLLNNNNNNNNNNNYNNNNNNDNNNWKMSSLYYIYTASFVYQTACSLSY